MAFIRTADSNDAYADNNDSNDADNNDADNNDADNNDSNDADDDDSNDSNDADNNDSNDTDDDILQQNSLDFDAHSRSRCQWHQTKSVPIISYRTKN